MSRFLAGLIVHISAWLAPHDLRARWREEWLAEFDAIRRAPNFTLRTSNFRLLRSNAGAPKDAVLRIRSWSRPALRSGWRGDLTRASRVLRREPWHVVAVSLCLGVRITAAVTTFSVLNGIFYAEIPGVANRAALFELHLRETGRMAHFPGVSAGDDRRVFSVAPLLVVGLASAVIPARRAAPSIPSRP